jgi:membrane-associated protein
MIYQIISLIETYLPYFVIISPLITQLGVPLGYTFFIMLYGSTLNSWYLYFLSILIISTTLLIGDIITYFIGKKYGTRIIASKHLSPAIKKSITTISSKIENNLTITLLLSRAILIGIIFISNYLTGIKNISLKKLIPLLFISEIIYTSIYLGIGFFLKETWEYIFYILSDFSQIIVSVIILYFLITTQIKHYKKRKIETEVTNN